MPDLPTSSEPRRWTISTWPDGQGFVSGPSTAPPEDSGLVGIEWVKAARVEVMEAVVTDEMVERAARSICDDGVRTLNGQWATWEKHADGFRNMARRALARAFSTSSEEARSDG